MSLLRNNPFYSNRGIFMPFFIFLTDCQISEFFLLLKMASQEVGVEWGEFQDVYGSRCWKTCVQVTVTGGRRQISFRNNGQANASTIRPMNMCNSSRLSAKLPWWLHYSIPLDVSFGILPSVSVINLKAVSLSFCFYTNLHFLQTPSGISRSLNTLYTA